MTWKTVTSARDHLCPSGKLLEEGEQEIMSSKDKSYKATTPEQVAYFLMKVVARNEGKPLDQGSAKGVDRAYILDLYAICLEATAGRRKIKSG